ncbi:hypothetical protein ACFCWY_08570 [Streptomyces sp. NPDC056362]|uniref:hypothetical protein n=1 Tax=unclassified Streptomyces TaxID=2593676 RepID=UPI0035DDA1C2
MSATPPAAALSLALTSRGLVFDEARGDLADRYLVVGVQSGDRPGPDVHRRYAHAFLTVPGAEGATLEASQGDGSEWSTVLGTDVDVPHSESEGRSFPVEDTDAVADYLTAWCTPGRRAVVDVIRAAKPGVHTLHVAHTAEWLHREERAEFLTFGNGRAHIAFGSGQAAALDRVVALVEEAMRCGVGTLTLVSRVPVEEELPVAVYRVHDGRCLSVAEYDVERYGDYPEALAEAERHRARRAIRARALYAPASA